MRAFALRGRRPGTSKTATWRSATADGTSGTLRASSIRAMICNLCRTGIPPESDRLPLRESVKKGIFSDKTAGCDRLTQNIRTIEVKAVKLYLSLIVKIAPLLR